MDFIYTLSDPRNNQVRYVGKTDNPDRRLAMHLNERYKSHKNNWIQGLIAKGLKPILAIIEMVEDGENWEERERYWISYFRSIGCNLTNMTDGGDQGPDCTGKNLIKSEEGRKNIIAALVKRNKSPEGREASRRSGLMKKGKKQSPETIEKRRKAMTGRKLNISDESRKKLIERNKTREYDPEVMSKNAHKLWDDPIKSAEIRARISERNKTDEFKQMLKTRTFNPETMSKNSRKLWDDPIKAADARAKLIERNKARKKHKDNS